MSASTDDLQRIIRLDVNATQALAALDKLNRQTGQVDKNVQTMADGMQASFDKVKNVVGVLTTAFAAFKGIKAITDAGDAVRSLTGSFEALLGSAERASGMVGEVFDIVQNTGAKFEDVGQSVTRLSVALADVGASNATIAQISENFIKLGRIGGSSMQDVSRSMVQFTQALASGRLGGDELKSILEGMPLIAKEIAKEMGVSVGELKELGSQGKITADILVNALLKNTGRIAEDFAKLPLTMEQAFNKMTSVGTQMLANFDKVSGLSKTIAIAFGIISDMLVGINDDLSDTSDEMTSWERVAVAVGNAFRGVLIVVNTLVGGVRQLVAGLAGTGNVLAAFTRALVMPLGTGWADVSKAASETADSVVRIGKETNAASHALAMGESTRKTAARSQRDYEENSKKVAAALKAQADAAGKAGEKMKKVKPPEMSEFDKWQQSLLDSASALDVIPEKIAFLNDQLAIMESLGEQNTVVYKVYAKTLAELQASIDPVAAAFQKVNDSIKESQNNFETIVQFEAKLAILAAQGKATTAEFKALEEALIKLKAAAGSPFAKVEEDVRALRTAAQAADGYIEALIQKLGSGEITGEEFGELAKKFENAGKAAKDANDKVKTLGEAVGEAGAKFVTDFVDTLIDGFGKVDTSFGDMIESMLKQVAKLMTNVMFQNFIKSLAGTEFGSWIGAGGKAQGAAYDAHGMQFFAQGGIVTQPTLFAHGAGFGVMGERGAEAIVPLKRSASGDLGVVASPVTINIQNNSSAEVTQSTTDNADGSRVVELLIEDKVRGMFATGRMDKTMRGAYGLSRQPAAG